MSRRYQQLHAHQGMETALIQVRFRHSVSIVHTSWTFFLSISNANATRQLNEFWLVVSAHDLKQLEQRC